MRDAVEGKVNGGPHKYSPRGCEGDAKATGGGGRRPWTSWKKEIEGAGWAPRLDRTAKVKRNRRRRRRRRRRGWCTARFYSREAPVAAGRSPTINSVLWSAKSYDGNRVNHAGTRTRVRRPRASVWKRVNAYLPHTRVHVSDRA